LPINKQAPHWAADSRTGCLI